VYTFAGWYRFRGCVSEVGRAKVAPVAVLAAAAEHHTHHGICLELLAQEDYKLRELGIQGYLVAIQGPH
jgi:hypothetical protein